MSAVVHESDVQSDQPFSFRVFAIAFLVGTAVGVAVAQDRPPGQLDAQCANQCAADGYDAHYCGNVCWIPAPTKARPDEAINWVCMTDCRNAGGRFADCRQLCKLR